MGEYGLDATHDDERCAACGVSLRPESRFCHSCGVTLGEPAAAARPRRSSSWELRHIDSSLVPVAILFLLMISISGVASVFEPSAAVELIATSLNAALVFVFCWRDRKDLRPLLLWSWSRPIPAETLIVPIVVFPAVWLYVRIVEGLGFEVLPPQAGRPYFGTAMIALLLCVVAPVVEELAFRGYMLSRLRRVLGPAEALVIQAALFSVLHLAPLSFVSHFVLGLALGIVVLRSESLYPAIAIHAAWNLLAIFVV